MLPGPPLLCGKIVTNKQWSPKIVQRNAVGQLSLKNVWRTKMFGYFQNTPFQPQTAWKTCETNVLFDLCVYTNILESILLWIQILRN